MNAVRTRIASIGKRNRAKALRSHLIALYKAFHDLPGPEFHIVNSCGALIAGLEQAEMWQDLSAREVRRSRRVADDFIVGLQRALPRRLRPRVRKAADIYRTYYAEAPSFESVPRPR
jgi:hypothetical protein